MHLEIAHSLGTDACVNGIRRFIAQIGPPPLIRSDNGTNLMASERNLRKELRSDRPLHLNMEEYGNY